MAVDMARVQYLFCICLSVSIREIYVIILLFSYLKNLTIDNVCTTNHAQNDKNGDENAPCSQPFIDV